MTRRAGVLAAAAALLGGAGAGCASSGATSSGGSAAASSPAAVSSAEAGMSLALSHMKVLTRLDHQQLCAALSPAEATSILGAPIAAPVYTAEKGLGITCQWIKRGGTRTSADQLYVGISSVISWKGARAADRKLLKTETVKVAGHPALASAPQGKVTWAQVEVGLGGPHDPVAEFRAPTRAAALKLATTAVPHLVAMG